MLSLYAGCEAMGGKATSRSRCYTVGFIVSARGPVADSNSLPDSHYDDDQSFQALKFKFVGNLEITDIVGSISLYIKKVQGMGRKLENLLAHHLP